MLHGPSSISYVIPNFYSIDSFFSEGKYFQHLQKQIQSFYLTFIYLPAITATASTFVLHSQGSKDSVFLFLFHIPVPICFQSIEVCMPSNSTVQVQMLLENVKYSPVANFRSPFKLGSSPSTPLNGIYCCEIASGSDSKMPSPWFPWN